MMNQRMEFSHLSEPRRGYRPARQARRISDPKDRSRWWAERILVEKEKPGKWPIALEDESDTGE